MKDQNLRVGLVVFKNFGKPCCPSISPSEIRNVTASPPEFDGFLLFDLHSFQIFISQIMEGVLLAFIVNV